MVPVARGKEQLERQEFRGIYASEINTRWQI
jgi:hypothetical protein